MRIKLKENKYLEFRKPWNILYVVKAPETCKCKRPGGMPFQACTSCGGFINPDTKAIRNWIEKVDKI